MSRVPLPYLDPQNESLGLLIANPKSWNVTPYMDNCAREADGAACHFLDRLSYRRNQS